MSVIFLLIAVSISVAVVFLVIFIIAVKSGQFEDTHTPGVRMLFEDETIKTKTEKKKLNKT